MADGLLHVLRSAHNTQNTLAVSLSMMATEHAADAEVHHVVVDLLGWTRDSVQQIAELAARQGVLLDEDADEPGLFQKARASVASKARGTAASMLLLENLRRLYLAASDASLSWELLAQYAQAKRLPEILQLTTSRHPYTLRAMKWANTTLKALAPQALAS